MPIATETFAMTPLSSPSAPKRIASLLTAINVLVAGGFSIAALVSPKSILPAGYAPTEASFIFAMYAAARSIPLALIAIYKQSEAALLILATLAGFIQLLDAGVGLLQHDLGKAIGPLVIAAFQFFAVYLLNRSERSAE
jgi:methyl coenzyme M reductase beta subunit